VWRLCSRGSLRRVAHELGEKAPCSSERYSPKREIVMDGLWLQDSPPRRENFGVQAKGAFASASKVSPKRVFVSCYCHRLAQAREPSLSESGLIA